MILPSSLSDYQSVIVRTSAEVAVEPSDLPPFSNTGVACTNQTPNRILIDYLAFTAPAGTSADDLIPNSGEWDWLPGDGGRQGYKSNLRYGNITIYSNGQANMGVHVIISGQGCRELEASGVISEDRIGGWPGYIRLIRSYGYHITRIDVAIDDYSGLLDIDILKTIVSNNHCVSKWHDSTFISKQSLSGKRKGNTLSFGARSSDIYCRIYDKILEKINKGIELNGYETWVRVEVEFKDKKADAFADIIASGAAIGPTISGILVNYLQFKVQTGSDSNIRRWNMLPQWETFLSNAEKVILHIEPAIRTLETVRQWIINAIGPSLAILVIAAGGDLDILNEIIELGSRRLKTRHLVLLSGVT